MTTSQQASPADAVLRVMGIDPGLADVGFGVIDWDLKLSKARLVEYGVVRTGPELSLADRLDHIYRQLSALVAKLEPQAVSIEQLFFAKNVKTAMVVAHGRAACILATTARPGLRVFEYTPLQIKQALTGHGRASKMQVQLMVRAVLGLAEIPRPDHAADALAAALCHVHSLALAEKVELAQTRTGAAGELASEMSPAKLLLAQARSHHRRRR